MRLSPWIIIGSVGGIAIARAIGTRLRRNAGPEEAHAQSLTALAGEALRTNVSPLARPAVAEPEMAQEDGRLRAGDPDVDPLNAALVGDDAPGGHMATPDHDGVDDIGRAYGLSEEDAGELRSAAEILQKRDRRRKR